MLNQPIDIDKAIPEDPIHEDELTCQSPHPNHGQQLPLLLMPEKAQRMAEFFGLLADANRLRILSILAMQERCVGDLALILGMNESAVSHQLRTLRTLRLVSYRKQGRHVFYQLQDQHVLALYEAVAEHLDEVQDRSSRTGQREVLLEVESV